MSVPAEAIEATARVLAVEFGGNWTDHEAAASELLAPAAPLIAAAERDRLAAVITPAMFRNLAGWFDDDDALKIATWPEIWPERAHDLQDDLRRFADLLAGDQS